MKKSKLRMIREDIDFFSPVNFKKLKLSTLTKRQLVNIIKELNRQMQESVSNWDGG